MNDPSRTGYRDILDKSGPDGRLSHILDIADFHTISEDIVPDMEPDEEAAAVAAAIGYKQGRDAERRGSVSSTGHGHPLVKIPSNTSAGTDVTDSPEVLRRIMKSPEPGNLESPDVSPPESEDSDEEDEDAMRRLRKPSRVNNDDLLHMITRDSDDEDQRGRGGLGRGATEEEERRRREMEENRSPSRTRELNRNPKYARLGIP